MASGTNRLPGNSPSGTTQRGGGAKPSGSAGVRGAPPISTRNRPAAQGTREAIQKLKGGGRGGKRGG